LQCQCIEVGKLLRFELCSAYDSRLAGRTGLKSSAFGLKYHLKDYPLLRLCRMSRLDRLKYMSAENQGKMRGHGRPKLGYPA
jgi:hypothetical protein